MNGFLHYLNEMKSMIVYHGDNFNTKTLKYSLMYHGNNQEGVGIYFHPSIDFAKSYGKDIMSTDISNLKLLNSRDIVKGKINKMKIRQFLRELNKVDSEFWYYFTDFGIDVESQDDVNSNHIAELTDLVSNNEIRNFQIEIMDNLSISNKEQVFVEAWLKFIKIDGLVNKAEKIYALMRVNK